MKPPRLAKALATVTPDKPADRVRRGFELHPTDSRFPVGPNPRQVRENGFDKVVGDHGVFAYKPANGASFGVPNADAPATRRPAMTKDGDLHNDRVLSYFLQAGLPKDQVRNVNVSTLMEMGGSAVDSVPRPPEFKAFNSGIQRSVGGIPVPDSMAWARFNANDESVEEGVFWPSVPESVLDTAHSLETMLTDADLRREYLAKISSPASDTGRVVIRHSSFNLDEAPRFYASYDVTEAAGPGMVVVRHFDANGNEFRLPQESASGVPEERVN